MKKMKVESLCKCWLNRSSFWLYKTSPNNKICVSNMKGGSVVLRFSRLYSVGVGGVQESVVTKQYVKQELIRQLTKLRDQVGETHQKSPKTVLNDKDIYNIVDCLPNTLNQLKQIKNIGDQKVKLVGKDVINIIKNYNNNSNKHESNPEVKIQKNLHAKKGVLSKNEDLEVTVLTSQKVKDDQKNKVSPCQKQQQINDEFNIQESGKNYEKIGVNNSLLNQSKDLKSTQFQYKEEISVDLESQQKDLSEKEFDSKQNISINAQVKFDSQKNQSGDENIVNRQKINQKDGQQHIT
eukprot:TRINITY_DN5020_c0_g3_i2.p1 TRINITY_DN5020_c0_g3~~TRINITY_DN5020_c0_g3_i2.p1  ORF type:complete len:294 (-),score=31.76 TRINITY_DN5020_c0_g3_i2:74-955(-)